MRGEARAGTSIHVPAPSPKFPGSITRGSHQPLPRGVREETKPGRERGNGGAKLKKIRATPRVTGAPRAEITDLEASGNSLCRALLAFQAFSVPGLQKADFAHGSKQPRQRAARASLSQRKASQPRRCQGGSWQRHHEQSWKVCPHFLPRGLKAAK